MGCINSSPEIIISSVKILKNDARKKLTKTKKKIYDIIDFTFANREEDDDTFHSSIEQSQKPIRAKIGEKEFIFL